MAQVVITTPESILSQLLEKDERDCNALLEAYGLASMYADNDDVVKEYALEFDPNFLLQVQQGKADLENVERPILVIGETSAGKSSFLNLLIGRNILPELNAPCTHCMCRLKKGQTLKAYVTYGDGSKPKLISGDGMADREFQAKLKDLVNEENCAQTINRCINIYVPSPFLEENVCLVDTPGFGEKERITESLVRFLPKAIGIIFILNPTVNLGVADDRGALILDEIKRLAKVGQLPSFDPGKVVFIANKWDQLEEDERKDHREKIIKKMQTLWPHFQEEQLVSLSVKHVRKAVDRVDGKSCKKKYQSALKDYNKVLDKIREVVQHCAVARSNVHTRYLKQFLNHLKTRLHVVESYSRLSADCRRGNPTILQKLVLDLESTHKQGEKTIIALSGIQVEIAQYVHRHLNNAVTRERMFAFDENNFPDGNDYSTLKKHARVAIRKNIIKAIGSGIEECKSMAEGLINNLSELSLTIEKKEAMIEWILKHIESNSEFDLCAATDLPTKVNYATDLSKKKIAAMLLASPLWVPLGVAGMVTVVPVTLAVHLGRKSYKLSHYNANTSLYLERWTKKILKEYDLDELKYIIFDKLFRAIHEKMRNFSKSIAKYKKTLKYINRLSQTEAVLRSYTTMRELCFRLDGTLPKSQNR